MQSSMVAYFWDQMELFHRHSHGAYHAGREGLEAFHEIRSLVEPYWDDSAVGRHPLRNWVGRASNRDYLKLRQLALVLGRLRDLPGFGVVARRLASPTEFLSAMGELDTALRLTLGGWEASFLVPSSEPTPDIKGVAGNTSAIFEVTSLNPAREGELASEFMVSVMDVMLRKKVAAGGFVTRIPSVKEVNNLKEKVTAAADEANSRQRLVKVNVGGLALIYVAPQGIPRGIPHGLAGQFSFWENSPLPHKDKLARKIREKAHDLANVDGPAFVVIYDRLGSAGAEKGFNDHSHDLDVVAAASPSIVGWALLGRSEFATQAHPVVRKSQGNFTYQSHILPLGHVMPTDVDEHLLLWGNLHAEYQMPTELKAAFLEYPTNLHTFMASQGLT